jgi:TonB family protein
VYARAGNGSARFTIEECSGTKLLSMAEKDVKYINGLAAPDPGLLEGQGGLQSISKPPPSYPKAAKAAGISGAVYVKIRPDETGKVINTQSVCGPAELVTSAEQAIRSWQPVLVSGKPVKVTTVVTANFVR